MVESLNLGCLTSSILGPLSERPIFHQTETRVETHIFICILAYHLLVAI